MQGRSWMAALTLAAGLFPTASLADDPQPPKTNATAEVKPQVVRLDLWIRGLGKDGCDVDVKAAHPGCKFQPVTRHVSPEGKLTLELKDVEILSADRDCTFAITIREPGQGERTMFRGLRIKAAAEKNQLAILTCYLSSPSRLARAGEGSSTKR